MSASLKKSFADVTRRKGRTLMVVLGIFIGVLGLTSVTFIQQTLLSAFTYSTGTAANSPDITLQVNRLEPGADTTAFCRCERASGANAIGLCDAVARQR